MFVSIEVNLKGLVVGLYQPLADGWMIQPDQTSKIQKSINKNHKTFI